MAAQNIYDKPSFFDAYSALPRNTDGLSGAYEWPTLRSLIGTINPTDDVLDLGCGQGHFCRWAAAAGVRSVHGTDISIKMLAKARALTAETNEATAARITYSQQDLTHWRPHHATYDLIYSCFAFHYMPHDALASVFASVAQSLKTPGGRFVFAVEHPVFAAPSDATWKQRATEPESESGNAGGGRRGRGLYWPLDRYFGEGLRVKNWLGEENVHKYHHTVETYMSLLLRHNFVLTGFRESWDGMPEPFEPESMEDFKGFHVPFFLMISARLDARE